MLYSRSLLVTFLINSSVHDMEVLIIVFHDVLYLCDVSCNFFFFISTSSSSTRTFMKYLFLCFN